MYYVLEGPQEKESGENEEGEYYLLGETGGGEELTYDVPSPAPQPSKWLSPQTQGTPHCSTSD